VRGRGLMLGVELIDPDGVRTALGHLPANGTLARALKRACLEHGLIIESGGRHGAVIRFLPPLIITAADADAIVQRFETALASLWPATRTGRPDALSGVTT